MKANVARRRAEDQRTESSAIESFPKIALIRVPPRVVFTRGVCLVDESPIGGLELLPGLRVGLDSSFGKSHQRPAHGQMPIPGNAPQVRGQTRRYCDTLPDRSRSRSLARPCHELRITRMHQCRAEIPVGVLLNMPRRPLVVIRRRARKHHFRPHPRTPVQESSNNRTPVFNNLPARPSYSALTSVLS